MERPHPIYFKLNHMSVVWFFNTDHPDHANKSLLIEMNLAVTLEYKVIKVSA